MREQCVGASREFKGGHVRAHERVKVATSLREVPTPLFVIRRTPEKQAEAEEDVLSCRWTLRDLPRLGEKNGWSRE
jgi:hypothetical protein